ncbi:MAG TPA: Sec-independent protein translocase protein TatB [Wenzhouxiangella sp.]
MGGIGFTELLLLAVIALLVVGPKRLPEIARTAGQLSKTARGAWQSLKSEFQVELDLEHNKKVLAKNPSVNAPASEKRTQTSDHTPKDESEKSD